MTTISIKPSQVGKELATVQAKLQRVGMSAARAASYKLKAYLVRRVNDLGITDLGVYKNSFRVVAIPGGWAVKNEAPHAGIIELGARPHKVSMAGIIAIAGWVKRKLGISDGNEAMDVAWAIAKKIEREGQAPRYVMLGALPMARAFYSEEFARLTSGGL